MDNLSILNKKLSTYVSAGGQLRNVSDQLLLELLHAWENWPSSSADFYRELGFTRRQMAKLIGKAKKLKRTGHVSESEFIEISSEDVGIPTNSSFTCSIELAWEKNKIIRFGQVDTLMEFLKKSA